MACKRYNGKIKYLGAESISQEFKSAKVELKEEGDRCWINSYLVCNPDSLFKATEITKHEASLKPCRLLIKAKKGHSELHFKGAADSVTKELYEDVIKLQKKVCKQSPHVNRAEVGVKKWGGELPEPVLTAKKAPGAQPQVLSIMQAAQDNGNEKKLAELSLLNNQFTRVKEVSNHSLSADTNHSDSKENKSPLKHKMKDGFQGFNFYNSNTTQYDFTAKSKLVSRLGDGDALKPVQETLQSSVSAERSAEKPKQSRFSFAVHKQNSPSPGLPRSMTTSPQGLPNLGNSCFMNSSLQALLHVDAFVADMLAVYLRYGKKLEGQAALESPIYTLATLRRYMLSRNKEALISTLRRMKRIVSSSASYFRGFQQQDAHDFVCQILDLVKEEAKKVDQEQLASGTLSPPPDPPPTSALHSPLSHTDPSPVKMMSDQSHRDLDIDALNPTIANFEMKLLSTFECGNCGTKVKRVEEANHLSVDMPSSEVSEPSLQDTLDKFFHTQEVDFTCEICGQKVKARQTTQLLRLPRILTVQLKRFSFARRSQKVVQEVVVPRYLCLKDFCLKTGAEQATLPHLPFKLPQLAFLRIVNSTEKRNSKSGSEGSPSLFGPKPQALNGPEKIGEGGHRKALLPTPPKSAGDGEVSFKQHNSSELLDLTDSCDGQDADLQKAIMLSLGQTPEGKANDHAYPMSSNALEPAKTNELASEDLSKMTEEEQMEMAIERSLRDSLKVFTAVDSPPSHMSASAMTTTAPDADPNYLPDLDMDTREDASSKNSTFGDFMMGESRTSAADASLDQGVDSHEVRQWQSRSHPNPSRTPDTKLAWTGLVTQSPAKQRRNSDCTAEVSKQRIRTYSRKRKFSSGDRLLSSRALFQPTLLKKPGPDGDCEDTALVLRETGVSGAEDCLQDKKLAQEEGRVSESEDRAGEEGGRTGEEFPDMDYPDWEMLDQQVLAELGDTHPPHGTEGGGGVEEKENRAPRKGASEEAKTRAMDPLKDRARKRRFTQILKGSEPSSYRLISIINHQGLNTESGHYFSDVADIRKEPIQWHTYNDENVQPIDEVFVQTKRKTTGYIFIYLSKDIFDSIHQTSKQDGVVNAGKPSS